ncbi:formimidoylglutamase [Amycolatopsis rubida]|uniref:Formimidoylglutamase n=1 Tax=Amycolatopsis rubida TaxID=112413 RepID=A0A1I5RW60_9PSEU|nr:MULTISPECIES: formimidoylglutamase [Amycolatopsis]MYW96655.1 formimidoylglutamase [Amycolatopsis rubida]NEC61639.1 formimidoylglutamase [Amycolatopsis rubida]OAP21390.1 Formimidoylglutamase [Amycolatopsis sp. M39]SFP62627.1 formiminoglutamase [Amycolatopsis rubida]
MSTRKWTGREDGSGPEHRRWHHAVNEFSSGTGVSLIGFASDAGVRRNGGRPGARGGPDAIRQALASFAIRPEFAVSDAGDVVVEGDELEAGQENLGELVAKQLSDGNLPLVLGGGHETAYGSYLGLARSGLLDGRRLGILNLDAHFDLRTADRPSSGTPFRQIAAREAERGAEFAYAVAGISEPGNTAALFETAAGLNVRHLLDVDCQERRLEPVLDFVRGFVADVDALYLSIDLDVLPAAQAPGVSAPATLGVPAAVVLEVCRLVASDPKLALADITELNPVYDADHRTARIAARLAHTLVTSRPVPEGH